IPASRFGLRERNSRKNFPRIARQLAINIPEITPVLQEIVRENPDIITKTMREHLERSKIPTQAIVVVIDALDEYDGDGFSKIADDDRKDFVLDDKPPEVIGHDILLLFDYRLTGIRTERILLSDWPGDEGLQKLVIGRIFLFLIVFSADNTIIGAIVTLESLLSVPSLAKLRDLLERLVRLRLDPLYSVLRGLDNETVPVRLFHSLFRDFLLDPETRKNTPLRINETKHYISYYPSWRIAQDGIPSIDKRTLAPEEGCYRQSEDQLENSTA
ncbi:uncharacterized protein N7496_006036, partial [Penicillium cataractarum]